MIKKKRVNKYYVVFLLSLLLFTLLGIRFFRNFDLTQVLTEVGVLQPAMNLFWCQKKVKRVISLPDQTERPSLECPLRVKFIPRPSDESEWLPVIQVEYEDGEVKAFTRSQSGVFRWGNLFFESTNLGFVQK